MLNYGKPVMGLPLCQTELDEGLGHLDNPLDRIQKIEASHYWVGPFVSGLQFLQGL